MSLTWTGIAQPVKRLATGWTVRGSNPGAGEIFAPVHTVPGAHPAPLYIAGDKAVMAGLLQHSRM